jgi:hypothetical protein
MTKFTSEDELDTWFGYHPPSTPEIAQAHDQVRAACRNLAGVFSDLLPECPDKTVALRAVREAMYAANAVIAVQQRLYDPPPAAINSQVAHAPKVSVRSARQGPGVIALQREGDGATAGGAVVVVESASERGIVLKIEGRPHSIEVRWSAYGFVQTEWAPLDADSGWEMLRDSVGKVLYVRPVPPEYPDPNAVM